MVTREVRLWLNHRSWLKLFKKSWRSSQLQVPVKWWVHNPLRLHSVNLNLEVDRSPKLKLTPEVPRDKLDVAKMKLMELSCRRLFLTQEHCHPNLLQAFWNLKDLVCSILRMKALKWWKLVNFGLRIICIDLSFIFIRHAHLGQTMQD